MSTSLPETPSIFDIPSDGGVATIPETPSLFEQIEVNGGLDIAGQTEMFDQMGQIANEQRDSDANAFEVARDHYMNDKASKDKKWLSGTIEADKRLGANTAQSQHMLEMLNKAERHMRTGIGPGVLTEEDRELYSAALMEVREIGDKEGWFNSTSAKLFKGFFQGAAGVGEGIRDTAIGLGRGVANVGMDIVGTDEATQAAFNAPQAVQDQAMDLDALAGTVSKNRPGTGIGGFIAESAEMASEQVAPMLAAASTGGAGLGVAGTGILGTSFWTSQMYPGINKSIRDKGGSESAAFLVGLPTAAIAASLEHLQVMKLLPGKGAAEGIKKASFTQWAKANAVSTFKTYGEEVSIEMLQAVAESGGRFIASQAEGTDFDEVEEMKGVLENGIQAARSMPFLMGPGKAVEALGTAVGIKAIAEANQQREAYAKELLTILPKDNTFKITTVEQAEAALPAFNSVGEVTDEQFRKMFPGVALRDQNTPEGRRAFVDNFISEASQLGQQQANQVYGNEIVDQIQQQLQVEQSPIAQGIAATGPEAAPSFAQQWTQENPQAAGALLAEKNPSSRTAFERAGITDRMTAGERAVFVSEVQAERNAVTQTTQTATDAAQVQEDQAAIDHGAQVDSAMAPVYDFIDTVPEGTWDYVIQNNPDIVNNLQAAVESGDIAAIEAAKVELRQSMGMYNPDELTNLTKLERKNLKKKLRFHAKQFKVKNAGVGSLEALAGKLMSFWNKGAVDTTTDPVQAPTQPQAAPVVSKPKETPKPPETQQEAVQEPETEERPTHDSITSDDGVDKWTTHTKVGKTHRVVGMREVVEGEEPGGPFLDENAFMVVDDATVIKEGLTHKAALALAEKRESEAEPDHIVEANEKVEAPKPKRNGKKAKAEEKAVKRLSSSELTKELGTEVIIDNPGGEWEARQRKRAASGEYRGTRTGDVDRVLVPVDELLKLPGMNDEHTQIKAGNEVVDKYAKELEGGGDTKFAPFVNVEYDGSASISEGNHRARAYKQAGRTHVPVQVAYFAGGEKVAGPWSIDQLKKWKADADADATQSTPVKPDENVYYHGNRESSIPAKATGFGGLHVGTKVAAEQRLEQHVAGRKKGVPGAEQVHAVKITPKKPFNSPENPASEHAMTVAGALKGHVPTRADEIPSFDVLKEQGYDAVYYTNEVEDPGSISVLLFNASDAHLVSPKKPKRNGRKAPATSEAPTVSKTETVETPTSELPSEKYGIYTVQFKDGQRFAVRENMENERGGGDPVFSTQKEAVEYANDTKARDEANKIFQAKQDEKQRVIDEKEAEKQREIEDIDGFADDASPMKRGRVLKTLNRNISRNGRLMKRKNAIREAVAEGAVGGEREGKPAIIYPDGRYFHGTATGRDYANYLAEKQPTSKTEEKAPEKKPVKEKAEEARKKLSGTMEELRKHLKGKVFSGVDPELLALTAKLVKESVEAGVLTLAEFVSNIRADLKGAGLSDKAVDAAAEAAKTSWDEHSKPRKQNGKKSETTGTKHAKTDADRKKVGLPERKTPKERGEVESEESLDKEAAKQMKADPKLGKRLTADLRKSGRAMTALEEHIMGRYKRDLENRRLKGEDVLEEMTEAVLASTKAGEEEARALRARQEVRDADFSLPGLLRQHIDTVKEAPSKKQQAKYAEMADRIAKLEKENATLEEKLAKKEVADAIKKAKDAKAAPPAKKGTKKARLKKEASAAVAEFKSAWASLSEVGAVSDPKRQADKWVKITNAAAKVVKAYTSLGVESFLEMMSNVKTDIGAITTEQYDAMKEAWKKSRPTQSAEREASEAGTLARELTRYAVEAGITEQDAVVDAVLEDLTDMGFDLTRDEVMQAMTSRGPFREISDVSKKVQAIKKEIRQLLKTSPEGRAKEEKRRIANYKKSLDRQLAFWEKRTEDASQGKLPEKRKKSLMPEDKEIIDKKIKIDKEKYAARVEIEKAKRANWNAGQWLGHALLEATSLIPKTLSLGLELSFVLRQGFFYIKGHPIRAFHNLAQAIPAVFSARMAMAANEDIGDRPNASEYKQAEIDFTSKTGPQKQLEEMYQSRVIDYLENTEGLAWLPLRAIAHAYMMTERGNRTWANTMKADMYDIQKRDTMAARKAFGNDAEWSENDIKQAGRTSNIFSGRGTGLKGNNPWMDWLLLARRWAWSRIQADFVVPFQLMTPKQLGQWDADAGMRVAVAKVYVQALLGHAAKMALGYWLHSLLAGDDEDKQPKIEWDIRSTKWLDQQVGETTIDDLGGLTQLPTLVARAATGTMKNSKGEIVSTYGEDVNYGGNTAADFIMNYGRYKLGTGPSLGLDLLSGRDAVGNLVTPGEAIITRVTPLTAWEIAAAEKELGLAQGTAVALEAFFGASVSTYGDRTTYRNASPDKQKKTFEKDIENMDWDAPEKAPYSDLLTKEQNKEWSEQRQDKRRKVVYDSTYDPSNSGIKTAKSFNKAHEKLDKNQDALKSMKEDGVTHDEAQRFLYDYFKKNRKEWGGKNSYKLRRLELDRLYGEKDGWLDKPETKKWKKDSAERWKQWAKDK